VLPEETGERKGGGSGLRGGGALSAGRAGGNECGGGGTLSRVAVEDEHSLRKRTHSNCTELLGSDPPFHLKHVPKRFSEYKRAVNNALATPPISRREVQ
jgi:hypothetical protein